MGLVEKIVGAGGVDEIVELVGESSVEMAGDAVGETLEVGAEEVFEVGVERGAAVDGLRAKVERLQAGLGK